MTLNPPKEVEDRNDVIIVGNIVSVPKFSHKFNNDNYYSLIIEVPRNSGKVDVIHSFLPEFLVNEEILTSGNKVKVLGTLIQSRLEDKKDLSVLIVEYYLTDEEYSNDIVITGRINNVFDTKEIPGTTKRIKQLILKKVSDDNRFLTFKVSCWNSISRLVESKYSLGDILLVTGSISSSHNNSIVLHEITASHITNA